MDLKVYMDFKEEAEKNDEAFMLERPETPLRLKMEKNWTK